MESAIWGLVGTFIGAAASIITTYLTNRNAAKLQSDARGVERIERSRAFQRETLLELQNAFHDAIRATAMAQLADVRASREGAAWGKNKLPDSLAEEVRVANRRVMLFVERVADDSVRAKVKAVMADASRVGLSSSREESQAMLDQVTFSSIAALEEIGKTLRALY